MSLSSHASVSEAADDEQFELIKADYGQSMDSPVRVVVKFPSSSYHQILDGIYRSPSWVAFPDKLAELMEKIAIIGRNGDRLSTQHEKMLETTISEVLPDILPKVFDDSAVRHWKRPIQQDILLTCLALNKLVIVRLQAAVNTRNKEERHDFGVDLGNLLPLLTMAFDCNTNFHIRNREEDVMKNLPVLPSVWAHALVEAEVDQPAGKDNEVVITLDPSLQHLWLEYAINHFGEEGGFQQVVGILQQPKLHNIQLLDYVLAPLAKAESFLQPHAFEMLREPLLGLLEYIQRDLFDDPASALNTGGSKELHFAVLSSLLEKADILLRSGQDGADTADAEQVGKVRRELILKLLAQGSFSKHLSAVRETNNLLIKALNMRAIDQGRAVRVNIEWMRKNDVVKNLLRANLHQKQYVDQVQKVLKNLTIEGGLQEDHLDLLWNLTEKVDTFEVVKNNIFDMLGDLAQEFNPEQLDILFSKFEACRARPLTDAMKIMDVMRRFAASDTKGVMAKRVMDLLWSIMMNPEAPTEVSKSPAMTDALAAYAQRKVAVDQEVASAYIRQCVAQIESDSSVSAAMKLLQRLVHLCFCQDLLTDNRVPRMSEDDFSLVDTVIGSLERCVAKERAVYASQGIQTPTDHSSDKYSTNLGEYAAFLVSLPAGGRLQISWPHIERIWDALVDKPATHDDRVLGLQLLNELAVNQGLSKETMRLIMEKKLNFVAIGDLVRREIDSFHGLFLNCFNEICLTGLQPGQSGAPPAADASPIQGVLSKSGVPIFWRMVLDMPDDGSQRISACQQMLVTMYTDFNYHRQDDIKPVRAQFVKSCLGALDEAAKQLIGNGQVGGTPVTVSPSEDSLPARRAARALSLLQDFLRACQGKAMPIAPMHAASFRGSQRKFEITANRPQLQKVRIVCHTNMYVGQLRALTAAKLNVPADCLRLIVHGQELTSDSSLIKDLRLADMTHILAAVAPTPTSSRQAPKAATSVEEETSPTALLAGSEGIFSLLLNLADLCNNEHVRQNAQQLLDLLPTDPSIIAELSQALASDQPQQAIRQALQMARTPKRPARLLYVLQTLTALLFPIVPAVDEEAGQSPLQRAFISSGCVSILIEAVSTLAGTVGPGALKSLFAATQVLFGQLLSMNTHVNVKTGDTAMTEASPATANGPSSEAQNVNGSPSTAEGAEVAEGENGSALDRQTLTFMLLYYLNLVVQAGSHNHLPPQMQMLVRDEQDSAICQDAFQAIKQLLEICPDLQKELFHQEMFQKTLCMVMVESLLNPNHEGIRASAFNLGQRLSASPRGHLLLLQLLSDFSKADEQPHCCKEYFSLVIELLRSKFASRNEADEVVVKIEEQMLEKLLVMSHTMTTKDELDMTLQWKLRLLLTLIQILDRRDVGTPNSGNLVHRLIVDYLFPESWFLHNLESKDLKDVPLEKVGQAFHARCNHAEDRQAALELLKDLMSHNSTNLQEGLELIRKIHLSIDIIPDHRLDFRIFAFTKKPHAFVGLKNGGATCYMNSIFQQLFMQPSIRRSILSAPEMWENKSDLTDNVFFQLQTVFAHLALSSRDVYTPREFWRAFKDYDGEELNIREHQDGYEFFTRLQDLVDQQMKLQGQKPAMQLVMGGKFANQIICKNVNFRSEKEEDFYQISLDVRGKRNLQESLDFYVQGELMEGDNQYFCEDLGTKTDAVKRTCIKVLPHMLVIHLKRFEYDYETMTRGKIKDRFEFPEELDMYNYTVIGLEAREAEEEAEASGRDPLQADESAQAYRAQCQYRLKGVVVHSGTAFAGHYYSFIKMRNERGGLSANAGDWFCFDDTHVTLWDVAKLDEDCFGGKYTPDPENSHINREGFERPNSAYLLFYEKSEELEPIENLDSLALDPLPNTPVSDPGAMDTPTLQQNGASMGSGHSIISCRDPPVAPLLAVPIPDISTSIPTVYNSVFFENLQALQQIRLVEREYFKFIITMVKDRSEAPFMPPSSMRRTEATTSSGSSQPPGSPRPASDVSSHRDDSVDRAAETLINFAGQFLLRVYLKCAAALREDQEEWYAVIVTIIDANLAANRWLLYLLACDSHQFSPNTTPDLKRPHKGDLENYLVYCPWDDVSRLVAMLMMRAIKNSLNKESLHLKKLDGLPSSQAFNNVLACYNQMLSNPELLDTKYESRHFLFYFLLFLKEYATLSPITRDHCNQGGILRLAVQQIAFYEGSKESVVQGMLEIISVLIRGVECGPVVKEGRPNPYSLPQPQRWRPLAEMYDLLLEQDHVRDFIMHPSIIKASEHIAELWKFLTWNNKELTLQWIHKYQTYARTWNYQSILDLYAGLLRTTDVRDQFRIQRLTYLLKEKDGLLLQATNTPGNQMQQNKRYQLIRMCVALCEVDAQVFHQSAAECKLEWLKLAEWLEKIERSNPQLACSRSFMQLEQSLQSFISCLQEQDVVEASEDSQVQESESDSMGEREGE